MLEWSNDVFVFEIIDSPSESSFFQIRLKIAIEYKEIFSGKRLLVLKYFNQSILYDLWHFKSKFCQKCKFLANIGNQKNASKLDYWQILELMWVGIFDLLRRFGCASLQMCQMRGGFFLFAWDRTLCFPNV